MSRHHHHLCRRCGAAKVPCEGIWERNEDGFPEVICRDFHLPNGELNPECLCDPCRRKQDKEAA